VGATATATAPVATATPTGYAAPSAPPPFAPSGWTDPGARTDDTGGIGGLFAGAERAPAGDPPRPPGLQTAVLPGQWGGPPPGRSPAPGEPAGRSGRRVLALVVVALVVLAAVAVGGIVLLTQGLHRSSSTGSAAAPSAAAAAPELAIGSTHTADGQTFTLQALKVDSTCVGHAYGQVAGYLATTPCTGLSRALYSAEVGGREMVLAISHTRMPDAAAVTRLKAMADNSGTGNVSDLLREGMTWAGGPTRLGSASEYASKPRGNVLVIVETAWVAPGAGSADQLDTAAENGVDLPVPAFAG
jgi:hypothetical protein